MLTDQELDAALVTSPAPRVTKSYITNRISELDGVTFTHLLPTVTLCSITLDNGYSVRGESACVNPENYNKEIGEKIAYDNAFQKLWPLFGFLLAEKQYLSS
jgi:hypothetical protein